MGFQELRQHLRVKAEGRAILQLPDGSRVRCTLHDLSLGGAYMIRSAEYGPPAAMSVGEVVHVTMFDEGNGGAYEMEAEVVRLEPLGGAGVALRWRHSEDRLSAFENHIQWEAKREHVPRSALGVPILHYPRSYLGAAERISKTVVPLAILLVVLGFASVGFAWLRAIFG